MNSTKNNLVMENIPTYIFDLIEQTPFEQLSTEQQNIVLQHMSKQEYESHYQTANILRKNKEDLLQVNPKQKEQLMQAFMNKQQSVKPIWETPVQLWKAAAIFILLGGAWLMHWQSYQHKKVEYVTQLDTVYLEKETPVKVYDTVYYKDESEASYVMNKKQNHQRNNDVSKHPSKHKGEFAEPIRRGVSAKDDSLIQSFKFVTL
jgi:hypothetical protein